MRDFHRRALVILAVAMSLAPVLPARAASWCTAGTAPDAAIQALRADAERLFAGHSRAVAHVHTEGSLPHQGIRDESVEAERDLPLIRDEALLWHGAHDRQALDRLSLLLEGWASLYQPSFNPIDETNFDALIDAYAMAKDDLPAATREKMKTLIHHWATGYIQAMQSQKVPEDKSGTQAPSEVNNGSKWATNWQSHRIKLATLSAVALDDAPLFDAARALFKKQIGTNLHADGLSTDFEERDALHYTVYDLEPLTRAAMAARLRGEDWLTLRGDNGASLAAGLDWLLPYARGEQVHEEYVHSRIKFDFQRRDAGVPGFSGPWDPENSANLYWTAATLEGAYAAVAKALKPAPAWISACWTVK